MTKIDPLDSEQINTSKILQVYDARFTMIAKEQPNELRNAIIGLQRFFAEETPLYEKGKEPKYNDLGVETDHGIKKKYLYQFTIENKHLFDKDAIIIDHAMGIIHTVISYYWEQLKKYKENPNMMPTIPFLPPNEKLNPQPTRPQNMMEKLGLQKPRNEPDPWDEKILELIRTTEMIPQKWMAIKAWYALSVKHNTNRMTNSDIYDRRGMELILSRLSEVFDYWITTLFLMTHKFAMDIELSKLQSSVEKFVDSLAKQQREHEKTMFQP